MNAVVILGCGYTGARVARQLLASGTHVLATTRNPRNLGTLAGMGADVVHVDTRDLVTLAALRARAANVPGPVAVLSCVPPAPTSDGGLEDPTRVLLAQLGAPTRVVYVSTTSVYGEQRHVDATTRPAPRTPADDARLAAEAVTLGGPWSGMVLRAAAIYGPSRGIHHRALSSAYRSLDPDRVLSRVHVEDLAALCVAALQSRVVGAWPVADRSPATPRELAAFCASIGLDVPELAPPGREQGGGGHGGRVVDGRAVFEACGVTVTYPSYREGIPAAVREERGAEG